MKGNLFAYQSKVNSDEFSFSARNKENYNTSIELKNNVDNLKVLFQLLFIIRTKKPGLHYVMLHMCSPVES